MILALLEEEVKSCRSLFEFGYSLFLVFFPNVKRSLEYFNRNKTRSVIY